MNAASIIWEMIEVIISDCPEPVAQTGTVVTFHRRKPPESQLPIDCTPDVLYNHIRMLDAPTYPKAFIEYGKWRIHFSDAKLKNNKVYAIAEFSHEGLDDE